MQKAIFLVDMNAFFISCEMTRNTSLVGHPAAVAGDPKRRGGIILAANYDARKFGIKTTMVLHEALRLCPNLILVPPDMRLYSQMSKQVMCILEEYTPIIEQNSIDEAWIDVTNGGYTSSDYYSLACEIMENIKNNLSLWCSIGISENKFLSKMASDMKKPLGITELWAKDVKMKLWPLPVESMYGVGAQTAAKLKSAGIYKIGDMAQCSKETLTRKFGKYGSALYELANGIDYSPVLPHEKDEMKSIGRSTTLPEDITDIKIAQKVLMSLSEEVGSVTRKHGKKATTVQITIKYNDFQTITRQKTIPDTCLTKEIYEVAIEILSKNWNSSRPVRLIGISITGFEHAENEQLSLFEKATSKHSEKEEKLENTVDKLRGRFGNKAIKRAVLIEKDTNR